MRPRAWPFEECYRLAGARIDHHLLTSMFFKGHRGLREFQIVHCLRADHRGLPWHRHILLQSMRKTAAAKEFYRNASAFLLFDLLFFCD